MEEKNVKTGFWSEYFKSLGNHPFRTVVATALVVDGAVAIAKCVFGRDLAE
jgi:hypothetical protein